MSGPLLSYESTVDEVCEWLDSVQLDKLKRPFRENNVDGRALFAIHRVGDWNFYRQIGVANHEILELLDEELEMIVEEGNGNVEGVHAETSSLRPQRARRVRSSEKDELFADVIEAGQSTSVLEEVTSDGKTRSSARRKGGRKPTAEAQDVTNKIVRHHKAQIDERRASINKQSKRDRRKTLLGVAVAKFNTKPSAGVEYLVEHKLISGPDDATGIATFLKDHHTTLNMKQVGDFMGGDGDTNIRVVEEFVETFRFNGMSIDDALREFLGYFRLPGEAQKIDRIMERFARRYHADNDGVFSHEDTAYILAFSIIMLNTDAHNDGIPEEDKMTLEQFIRNNSGIDNGNDLPRKLLEEVYTRIKKQEIEMSDTSIGKSDMSGWMTKQGGRIKTWKRRWFKLGKSQLLYFKDTKDIEPCGIIPLNNLSLELCGNGSHGFMFKLSLPKSGQGEYIKSAKLDKQQMVQGHHSEYIFATKTDEERQLWVNALEEHINVNNFDSILREKAQEVRKKRKGNENLILFSHF